MRAGECLSSTGGSCRATVSWSTCQSPTLQPCHYLYFDAFFHHLVTEVPVNLAVVFRGLSHINIQDLGGY